MIPTPSNLPLLLGQVTKDSQRQVLEVILKGRDDLKQNLHDLGQFWDIRVWFSQPVERRFPRRWTKVTYDGTITKAARSSELATEHIFHGFFMYNGKTLCYKPTRSSRRGYPFPSLELVTRYEPVIEDQAAKGFQTLQQFQARFDPQFITQAEIIKLWNGKSSQHGGKYKPSDFHRIGPQGKLVMKQFLRTFTGIGTTDKSKYTTTQYGTYLSEHYDSTSHTGRDISISHTFGKEYVNYSSEFHRCGNGRYGLVANKNEFLWLEDD